MRKMNEIDKKQIEWLVWWIMTKATSDEYAKQILDSKDGWTEKTFMEDVIENILETSAWDEEGYYNEDDVRLAIGRVFIDRMGIED